MPTIYVSPGGDDSRDGLTIGTSIRTISNALLRARPGDVVMLEGGATFNETIDIMPGRGGTKGKPIVFTSDIINRARILPSPADAGVKIFNAGDVTIENLVIVGQNWSDPKSFGVAAFATSGRYERIILRNLDVSGFNEGIQISSWEKPDDGFTDVLIEYCDLHDNLNGGGMTYASAAGGMRDFVVRHCRFYNNPGNPQETQKPSGSGFVFGGVENGLIEYCIAHDNGGQGAAHAGPVGIWAYNSSRITIQFCESYRNRAMHLDGDGFDFDMGVTDSVIQYCYSHDNFGAGYLLYQQGNDIWSNNVLRYNISENDATGTPRRMAAITLSSLAGPVGLKDAWVYGNTVYAKAGPAFMGPWEDNASNLYVFNNIFVTTNDQPVVWGWNPSKSYVTTLRGNIYWASGGQVDLEGLTSFDAWRNATGQETLNGYSTGRFIDPQLNLPGGGGVIGNPFDLRKLQAYRLLPGSPARDTGIDPKSFVQHPGPHDFFGIPLPQGVGYDVGAHEAEPISP
jgi:hypothetical protein